MVQPVADPAFNVVSESRMRQIFHICHESLEKLTVSRSSSMPSEGVIEVDFQAAARLRSPMTGVATSMANVYVLLQSPLRYGL